MSIGQLIKSKGFQRALTGATYTTGAVGLPLAFDYAMHPDDKKFGVDTIKSLFSGEMDRMRVMNLGLNAILGAAATKYTRGAITTGNGKDAMTAMGIVGGVVGKDIAMQSLPIPKKTKDVLDKIPTYLDQQNSASQAATDALHQNAKTMRNVSIGLGAGALGLGALGVGKYLTRKDPAKDTGKIRLKIPGKKGDPESAAEVEMALDTPDLHPKLLEGINRSIKLQTRQAARASAMKRDPNSGKLITYDEYQAKYGDPDAAPASNGAPTTPVVNTATPATGGAFGGFNPFQKSASSEWHEGAGTVLSTLASGGLGAYLGSMYGPELATSAGLQTKNKTLGAIVGGGLGAILPLLAAKGLSSMTGDRETKEQEENDQAPAVAEYLVPGYASYQHLKRLSAKKRSGGGGYEDDDMDDFGDEDDMDMDKEASTQAPAWYKLLVQAYIEKAAAGGPPPPPPGPPQGGPGGPPPPPPPPPPNVLARRPVQNGGVPQPGIGSEPPPGTPPSGGSSILADKVKNLTARISKMQKKASEQRSML